MTAYVIPYTTVVATIPFGTGGGLFVPIDDERVLALQARRRAAAAHPAGDTAATCSAIMPYVIRRRTAGHLRARLERPRTTT